VSVAEFVWLILIFGGIAVALWMLWVETVNAWYQWREPEEDER
jgi:hypothetical protein